MKCLDTRRNIDARRCRKSGIKNGIDQDCLMREWEGKTAFGTRIFILIDLKWLPELVDCHPPELLTFFFCWAGQKPWQVKRCNIKLFEQNVDAIKEQIKLRTNNGNSRFRYWSSSLRSSLLHLRNRDTQLQFAIPIWFAFSTNDKIIIII